MIPEYNSKQIADSLIKKLQNQFPLSQLVQEKIKEAGIHVPSSHALERSAYDQAVQSMQGSPQRQTESQMPVQTQESQPPAHNQSVEMSDSHLLDEFDLSSQALLTKYDDLMKIYREKQAQQSSARQQARPKLSAYEKLFVASKTDKPNDKHLKMLRKTIYKIFEWEEVYEKQFKQIQDSLLQRISEVIDKYVSAGNCQRAESAGRGPAIMRRARAIVPNLVQLNVYEIDCSNPLIFPITASDITEQLQDTFATVFRLQEELDMSMKDRVEFIDKILRDL